MHRCASLSLWALTQCGSLRCGQCSHPHVGDKCILLLQGWSSHAWFTAQNRQGTAKCSLFKEPQGQRQYTEAGNPNLCSRDTLFIRFPSLLYAPYLNHLHWYFPLANTDYSPMKILIKERVHFYQEGLQLPAFEHSSPDQCKHRYWDLTWAPCIFKLLSHQTQR